MKDRKRDYLPDSLKENPPKKEFDIVKEMKKQFSKIIDPQSIDLNNEEQKKKIGTIIIALIILVLIITTYYFIIYAPSQESLEIAKTNKYNELHNLYKGSLSDSPDVMKLEDKIDKANSVYEVKKINIMTPATKAWKIEHSKSISLNTDNFNRTMAVYEDNGTENVIMSVNDAMKIVNSSDAKVLSNIKFEMPNTVTIPVLISRLQAGGGLLSVGSIVDVYTMNSENNTNNSTTNIKSCTVVAILRYEDSGEIESEYASTHNIVSGNNTNPNEDSQTFKTNVLELIKSSLAAGKSEQETINLLNNYGVKLSNSERSINLGDLDAEYIILLETPSNKANYLINNMDHIILTIPTQNAPEWMVNEISSTYK